ncbi:MetQ/NlpA family ABC transporter substrate-binding protein [Reinekea marinisedimentorum]|uniref:Lipoprotein n=1 Tax=Reinekea marinisedimentorum TaxID=230495 RepID=A0A4R3IBG5_9GAMM|nr:MetQ/NlpA family ABC transporter substrate-binding protein [Reinekea marinisedimentorum]TCS42983.1 D-methionine transport system substrate-binding protein [Reinekea marinisedimentorum]
MFKKKIVRFLTVLPFALLLAACGDKDSQVIKVGATVGPHAEVVEAVAEEAAKQGLEVEVVIFSDYITPNAALADGSLDLNSYQHQPFLDNFNNNSEQKLSSIGRSILMRMGIYSSKYHSIEELPEQSRISIPNDPTNGSRALILLADANLITLKADADSKTTIYDIVENPKKFEFVEVEAAQLPRTLDDVDASVITMNYVMSSGLNPAEQGIYLESKDAEFAVMQIASRAEDKDNETYKKFVEIFHSEPVRQFIDTTYKGTIEAAF